MKDKYAIIEEWIDAYSAPLLRRALYMVSDKEEAEDMVQEVFTASFIAFDSFQNKSNPLTWLYAILHNKVADFYRKKYKNPIENNLSHFFDSNGNWKDESIIQPWEDTPEEWEQSLHECIEKLPPRWKIPLKLYYLKEKKNEVVCQEVGITPTNLWKILQRSRLQLRECLENNRFVG